MTINHIGAMICPLLRCLVAEYSSGVAGTVVRVDLSMNSMKKGKTVSRALEKSTINGST